MEGGSNEFREEPSVVPRRERSKKDAQRKVTLVIMDSELQKSRKKSLRIWGRWEKNMD